MRTDRPLLALVLLLAAAPSAAQFTQYTPAGSLAEITPSRRSRVEGGASEARWRLGRLRLDPRLQIGELGYVDNVFAAPDGEPAVSDYHAVVDLGLAAYLNFGPKVVVSAFAIPQYRWWQDLEERRELSLSSGLGLFGYFNRLTVEIEGQRLEQERRLSGEVEVPIEVRNNSASAGFEVDLRGPFSLFASLAGSRIRHEQQVGIEAGLDVSVLDRDETVSDLGLRYTLPSGLSIGLGARISEADFLSDPGGRSNSGTSPHLQIGLDSTRLGLQVSAVSTDIEFEGGADRRSLTRLTGSGQVVWKLRSENEVALYAARSLVYSVREADQYFIEDRYGLSIKSPIGRRLVAQVFGEVGLDSFEATGIGKLEREDEFTSVGGNLTVLIGREARLRIGGVRTDYDSSLPGFDRSVTTFRSGLDLGRTLLPW